MNTFSRVRQTSIDTFHKIEKEDLLSKMRFKTYRLLFEHGPMTASQLHLKAKELLGDKSLRDYHKRLPELRDLGVIQELGIVECPITKRKVILWDVTSQIPNKIDSSQKKQKINKLKLEGENNNLRELLNWCVQNIRHQIDLGKPISEKGYLWLEKAEQAVYRSNQN